MSPASKEIEMKRTRLGKVVGSITTAPEGFCYWPEANWRTGEPGFIVVAPSGARTTWHAEDQDALLAVAAKNRDWFADQSEEPEPVGPRHERGLKCDCGDC